LPNFGPDERLGDFFNTIGASTTSVMVADWL
jgi:hypothetical protein